MPQHKKDPPQKNIDDEMDGSADLETLIPKSKFPKTEREARQHFRSHPVQSAMTAEEASGFHH